MDIFALGDVELKLEDEHVLSVRKKAALWSACGVSAGLARFS